MAGGGVLLVVLFTATRSWQAAKPIDVSVRDVLTDPYAVDGKRVRLIGVLHRSANGDALYWHETDIEHANRSHAIPVEARSGWPAGAEQPGAYVSVEGVFQADDALCASDYNGTLHAANRAAVR